MSQRYPIAASVLSTLLFAFWTACAQDKEPEPAPPPDPFVPVYGKYDPGFRFPKGIDTERKKLSSEPHWYTLALLTESSRADALVEAGMKKEAAERYTEALEIYQKVIDDYPDVMYRVSQFGVFVPITQYCQLRILRFPKQALQHYRTKYDARAREAYEVARERNSLEGLAHIRDTMLCTSYGAPAMLTLGDMALDRGHCLEALGYYEAVRELFPSEGLHTPELALKVAYCHKMLGDKPGPAGKHGEPSRLASGNLERFKEFVAAAKYEKPAMHRQQSSAPHTAADDYMAMPVSTDPLGITPPVWERPLPAAPMAGFVFSQPVVAGNSVFYRHKNMIYCRSILNGELRWKNDLGGRVKWQNVGPRQYPQEDVLVQDGMVFTPIHKVGPTLVALDEITGQVKWAYGPMVASSKEESNMRFETAPAGGPMTVFAGYILDNIEGNTHTDTEYGVIAFDSVTGRVKWRAPISRLRPGLFTAGFAVRHRNRIRSFLSPPLYHQGVVYYCTNAGAIAALDSLSGRVKWLMKYPYDWGKSSVHDSTRGFGDSRGCFTRSGALCGTHRPMFWYNQRPLLLEDNLYVLPVDAPQMYKLDRRTGKILWRKTKGTGIHAHRTYGGPAYFLGPTRTGELAVVYSFRSVQKNWAGPYVGGGVHLIDPKNGKTIWESGDLIRIQENPVLKYRFGGANDFIVGTGMNGWGYITGARPFFSEDNKVVVTSYSYCGWPFFNWVSHLAIVDLGERKRIATRPYITPFYLDRAVWSIANAARKYKPMEDVPHKDDKLKWTIKALKEMEAATPPQNEHPEEFRPFSRVTFDRFGTRFELRFEPASLMMVYDRDKVKGALAPRKDAAALFAKAELAVSESRLKDAAGLLEDCLAQMSSEDLDFRATVNQLRYQVYKRLARGGARSLRSDLELKYCLGMSQSVGTLADEIETLFAFADALERKGDSEGAAARLQSIIRTYAAFEYPVAPLTLADAETIRALSEKVLDAAAEYGSASIYRKEAGHIMAMLKRGLSLYMGELAPVDKTATMRAGDLAVAKLLRIKQAQPKLREQLEASARTGLDREGPEDEQVTALWQYPGTATAQGALNRLLTKTDKTLQGKDLTLEDQAALRKRQWRLADAARICSLELPKSAVPALAAPPPPPAATGIKSPLRDSKLDLEEARGTAWLALERRGQRRTQPGRVFLGGRVKKKFDNKFVLYCLDAGTGKIAWKAEEKRGERWFEEIRLAGKGDEPGFFEAFVYGDIVVVHGWYDVLAFRMDSGKLKWRYRVPFDFEIKHAEMSGNLLVLAGNTESIVLYLGTDDPRGEVVWQEREEGDLYANPYLDGDRLVLVRKNPYNLTVRYRSTGKLIGRLSLPDLTLFEAHPLVEGAPNRVPMAHDGSRLVLSDGWYYIMLDVADMRVVWKRLIDANDATREPAMRFALAGDYLAVIKQDYDVKTIYMLNSKTGDVLWRTDPKVGSSPQPIYCMRIADGRLYGIRPHAGQGFYFVGRDCKTGKALFRDNEQKGYGGKPRVQLRPTLFGDAMVVEVQDRRDFELKAFNLKDGKLMHKMKVEAAGEFGTHGRASATVQNGKLLLLGKNTLMTGK